MEIKSNKTYTIELTQDELLTLITVSGLRPTIAVLMLVWTLNSLSLWKSYGSTLLTSQSSN